MTLRLYSTAQGFVHDILTIADLSEEPCNLRFLSDRSLYILQNLSSEDITFLSRYGTPQNENQYLPVLPDTPDAETVGEAVDLIRRDLTQDMACNDIVIAINALATQISNSSCGCPIGQGEDTTDTEQGGDVPPSIGDIVYEEPSAITDRKCMASNALHATIVEVFTRLEEYGVDNMGILGLTLAVSVITGIIASTVTTPIGGLIVGVAGGLAIFGARLIGVSVFSIEDILTVLDDQEEELVCALFQQTTSEGAKDAYLAELENAGLTAVEVALVGLMLTNSALAILFFDTPETAIFWETYTPPIDCSACTPAFGQWMISPSGFKGLVSVGGVPLGTGIIDQGGGVFSISSVQIDGSSQHVVSIQINGYNDDPGITSILGSDVTLIELDPDISSPTNLRDRQGDDCGDGILINQASTEGGNMPETLTGNLAFWYVLIGAFDLILSIDTLPEICP